MRSKESKRYRGINRSRLFFCLVLFFSFSGSGLFSGCIRVAGSAGAWKTDSAGEPTGKQAGFDTDKLLPGGGSQGKITV